jgi:hypothetical protein
VLNGKSSASHWIEIRRPRASDALSSSHKFGFIKDRLGSSIADSVGPHGDKGSDAGKIICDGMS